MHVCMLSRFSCVWLWDTVDCSLPGSSVQGILQARILEWVAMPSSQGIFPTQGSNPGLLHCRQILYQLSHKGSPRISEWVIYPISSRSSQPRNWTGISCIAGRLFTNWAMKEAQSQPYKETKKPQKLHTWQKILNKILRNIIVKYIPKL